MSWIYSLGHVLSSEVGRALFDHEVHGGHHRIEHGPALIACNHASYLDPPMIGCGYERPLHYVARQSLFGPGLISTILRHCNAIPINRDRPDLATIRRILAALKNKQRVVLFPEGTRSRDGSIGPAEAGVGMIVAKAGVPVQPVRLFGTFEALPRSAILPRPAKVDLVVGPPLQPEELLRPSASESKPDPRTVADRIMHTIAGLQLPR